MLIAKRLTTTVPLRPLDLLSMLATFLLTCMPLTAQESPFTYQGQLKLDGVLVTGEYDFKFTVYDGSDSFSANEQDSDVVTNVTVTDGLFTAEISFNSVIFDGRPLWLETQVRASGTTTLFALSPLQQMTPVPYATYAVNAAFLDGRDASEFVTEEVDPTLPSGVRSGCRICLGWADSNDPDPDVERCQSLSNPGLQTRNYLQFSGDVDENDRLWLWIECL